MKLKTVQQRTKDLKFVITDSKSDILHRELIKHDDMQYNLAVGKYLMKFIYRHPHVAGITASQLGIDACVFVVRRGTMLTTFINPHSLVANEDAKMDRFSEGCVSLPGEKVSIFRPDSISLTYTNTKGKEVTESFRDWTAKVIQHEYDHTQGILITTKKDTQDPAK